MTDHAAHSVICSYCLSAFEPLHRDIASGCSATIGETHIRGHYGSDFDLEMIRIGAAPKPLIPGAAICDTCIRLGLDEGWLENRGEGARFIKMGKGPELPDSDLVVIEGFET